MREWNLLRSYPQPEYRKIPKRTIEDRIIASYRGMDFFDGPRTQGYGGMNYDHRWGPIAEEIIADYRPKTVIQFQCEKGFLITELNSRGVRAVGVDSSAYARERYIMEDDWSPPQILSKVPEGHFDLCLALGCVYTLPLNQAMQMIREVERIAHKGFITLASYETLDDLDMFRRWTLLGTTILKKDEWREVLKHCGYTGDYWFVNAETLKLTDHDK